METACTRILLRSLVSSFAAVALTLGSASSSDAALPHEGLIDGSSQQPVSLASIVDRVQPGGVLIVSEQHGNLKHHARELESIRALHQAGHCTVSVGLEFLRWPFQDAIPKYLSGAISEADFLTAVEWGSDPFDHYREQARFPLVSGGELRAINAPSDLTRAISRAGLATLSPDLLTKMPPNFELGRADYRERFDQVMGQHVPPQALDNYFAAQSVWDETMAWQTREFLLAHPSHCLAIIVGDFHAAWGGGLPDRLRARGVTNVTVISQFETDGWSEAELAPEIEPHPRYGVRADAVWLSSKSISLP